MPTPRAWAAALAIGTLAAASVAVAASPASASVSPLAHLKARSVIDYHPTPQLRSLHAENRLAPALTGGLPTFTATQTDGAKNFKYTMVGKNPKGKLATPSTTVQAELVPLKFVFVDGSSSNAGAGNSCDSTPALTRTVNSPVVKNMAWSFGGTAMGTTQYVDAFRRAEFWKFTKPAGINPGYHVKLAFKTTAAQTIRVPAANSAKGTAGCGPEWAIGINWLDKYLQNTLLPKLRSQGVVKSNTFPFFLTVDTVAYLNNPNTGCCILGYHNAFNASNGIQTYGLADYQINNFFGAAANLHDIEAASHEVAEWMDDPLGTNPTKSWGNIGQVSGCQSNLEVGDPLSGTTINRKVGTYTYRLQELAFFSWFYHQTPSIGVHGWYSNNGSFKKPAAPCP